MNKLERLKFELMALKLEASQITLDQNGALQRYLHIKSQIQVLETFIKRLEDAKTFKDEGAAISG